MQQYTKLYTSSHHCAFGYFPTDAIGDMDLSPRKYHCPLPPNSGRCSNFCKKYYSSTDSIVLFLHCRWIPQHNSEKSAQSLITLKAVTITVFKKNNNQGSIWKLKLEENQVQFIFTIYKVLHWLQTSGHLYIDKLLFSTCPWQNYFSKLTSVIMWQETFNFKSLLHWLSLHTE